MKNIKTSQGYAEGQSSYLLIEDDHGGYPNVITVFYFLSLIIAMVANLWVFYMFQYY